MMLWEAREVLRKIDCDKYIFSIEPIREDIEKLSIRWTGPDAIDYAITIDIITISYP